MFLLSAVSAAKQQGEVVFNEVVSANSRSLVDETLGSPDWIELHNTSEKDFDLTGYRVSDKNDSAGFSLDGLTIPADGYLIIYASKDGAKHDPARCADFGISSAGETLYLIDRNNIALSQLTIPALPKDVSYARRKDGTYGYCIDTTPGAENSQNIMEKEQLESVLNAGRPVISEVLPRPGEGHAWAEIYNPGDSDVYLRNFFLSDNENDKTKWRITGEKLQPGEYLVVYFSGLAESGGMNASFKLGSRDTGIYLFNAEGNLLSSLCWEADIPSGICVVEGNGYTATPTKGGPNSTNTLSSTSFVTMDESDSVRLSEVLPKNKYSITDSDGERREWAEICNLSDESVPLSGYCLSDDESNLNKWAFPDISIAPKSFVVVFLSGKQSKENELHASFGLSEGEKGVYLTNMNSMRVDTLPLPETFPSNISVGRDSNGNAQYYAQPTPGSSNAKGFQEPSLIGFFDPEGLYISEVCAVNRPKSRINDWIEIYNGAAEAADLSGYFLSDNPNDPKKWLLPSLNIGAREHAVIEATSDLRRRKEGTADFSISPSGETLLLCDPGGNVIDVFDTGMLAAGITSGRMEGDSSINRVFFDRPTRGAANASKHSSGYSPMPIFSKTGLYHSEAFKLEITCASPEAQIFYTTDGSVPTEKSKRYKGPIEISKNTPVRAAAYAEGLLPSQVNTVTFIFDKPHTVPVFCISADPRDIRVIRTANKIGRKPEYPVNVEYYETDGSLGVSFLSGLRPKGRSSLQNPQKSLTMQLRSSYGQKEVTYPFFDDSGVTSFTTLSLRNSGQDNRNSRIRDSYFIRVIKGLNVDSIETKLAVAYVNGEYFGLYDLNEEQNADYITAHYGKVNGEIDMINRNSEVIYGNNNEFLRVRKLARKLDLRSDEVFEEFAKLVDVDACIDYLIAQIYIGNGDVLNQKFWRAKDYSVKWRPVLFDLDWSMRFNNSGRNVFRRYFSPSPVAGNGTVTYMDIFCGLKKNKAWCDKFVERFVELTMTQFKTERVLGIFDDMVAKMEPEMERHIKKWRTPRSMDTWKGELKRLRTAMEKREQIILKQLQSYFRVSNERMRNLIQKYSN